jgi:hypothetical protein
MPRGSDYPSYTFTHGHRLSCESSHIELVINVSEMTIGHSGS